MAHRDAMIFVAGHFGEWLQGCLGGQVVLVTLACRGCGARAARAEAPGLAVAAPAGLIDAERAAAFLAALGLPPTGRFTLTVDLPLAGGAGMSTATLVALARAAGAEPARIAAACLAVEGAVDPLMLPEPDQVLWAPRAARTVSAMPPPPAAAVLGGFWGAPVATDSRDTAFPDVADLVARWQRGPDLAEAAAIASLSAARATALRGPAGDPTAALARRLGASGWARAHTGSARALLFAPGQIPAGGEAALAAAGYTGVMRFETGGRA